MSILTICSDKYATAQEDIANDPIMRDMAYELTVSHEMSVADIEAKSDLLAVRDEYKARGGQVPAWGIGDYRLALILAAERACIAYGRTLYAMAYFETTGWPTQEG